MQYSRALVDCVQLRSMGNTTRWIVETPPPAVRVPVAKDANAAPCAFIYRMDVFPVTDEHLISTLQKAIPLGFEATTDPSRADGALLCGRANGEQRIEFSLFEKRIADLEQKGVSVPVSFSAVSVRVQVSTAPISSYASPGATTGGLRS